MIAVTGASVSGLFAAWCLGEAGHNVQLYEKEPAFQPYARRLIVTSFLFRLLSFPEDLILNRADGFEFFADGYRGHIQLKNADLIIDRRDLIQWLVGKAKKSGVGFREGTAFFGLSQDGKGVKVRLRHTLTGRHEEICPSILIGADGADSAVGRALGLRVPKVSILQAKIPLPSNHPANLARIYFDKQITPYFFWLFPDSPRTGIVGTVMDNGGEVRQALEGFIRKIRWKALQYEGGYTSLYVPCFRPEARMGGLRVFLIGDAAGQVKATTVGGTVPGLRGAEACVRAINKGTSYWEELVHLRRELWIHTLIRRFLNSLDDGDYGRILSSVDGRGSFLGRFSRDEMSSHLFPLLLRHPCFSFRVLRAVTKGM